MDSEREEARARWRAARDFRDLCRLAEEFLVGDLPFFPGWMAPDVDEETDPLVPDLVELCRAGLLPLASQPGHPARREHDERTWSRRAFLTAFASPTAARILERSGHRHWVLRSFPAEGGGGRREPVGLADDEPFLWAGDGRGPEELELFEDQVGAPALADLRRQRYLTVHDRDWGRGSELFAELARALAGGNPDPART